MKRGFTIVELILVVGIIGILMGIVTTAARSSMFTARTQRAEALFKMVETGLSTYYAMEGEWPVSDLAGGTKKDDDPQVVVLSSEQVRKCVQALVEKTKAGNPMIDVSGLWVATKDADPRTTGNYANFIRNSQVVGMDFVTAVRGSEKSRVKHRTSELYYGYADPKTGKFLRFYMSYSIPSDKISVGKWGGW